MKTVKQIIFIIILYLSYNTTIIAQNLDSMPVAKRDSILISTAKEVILKFGPDYYREYSKPTIEQRIVPEKGEKNPTGVNAGRISYLVTFLYDPNEEKLEWNYAANVGIWADTSIPITVMFGNGVGIVIQGGMDWRNDMSIGTIKYQDALKAIYDISDPNPDKLPVNHDELVRRGFVKQGTQWVRTRPDVPPYKRKGNN